MIIIIITIIIIVIIIIYIYVYIYICVVIYNIRHILNVGIPNLPFFRSSSKHVAGSISSGVCFDSHLRLFQRYHI